MISESPRRAFVWAWLPGASAPVPAGVLEDLGGIHTFAYARTYRERSRDAAPALWAPELPVGEGRQQPLDGLSVAGVLRDAGPDSWGQRVVMRRLLGHDVRDRDPVDLDLITYLLESGSDRAGALDFQQSNDHYVPRVHAAPLELLLEAADVVVSGAELPEPLAQALAAGASIGGARPKSTLVDGDRSLIAKFSALSDTYPVMRAEAVAMGLARRVGIDAAPTELVQVGGRDVLLVDRFDRGPDGVRHGFVSALTMLQLDEVSFRYASYVDLADRLREYASDRSAALRELFDRLVLNILVGNTDDHARNHAAFVGANGTVRLTPAYDVCPQPRAGQVATQAMAFAPPDPSGGTPAGTEQAKRSQLAACLAAADVFDLTTAAATGIVDHQVQTIVEQWHDAADEAHLTAAQRRELWGRQICNPYAFEGHSTAPAHPAA